MWVSVGGYNMVAVASKNADVKMLDSLFRKRFCISPTNVGKAILHRIIGMVWDKYSDEYECIFIPQIYAIMVKNTLSNWKK